MGKKVKRKAKSGQKDKRVGAINPKKGDEGDQNVSTGEVVEVVKEKRGCPHLDLCMDLGKVCSKVELAEGFRCEDCREGAGDRKAAKGKGKQGKKKGSNSKAIWVCLECGHFACGGVGLPNNDQSHAVRHARQSRHQLVVQLENPHLRWCFPCSSLIPVDRFESGEVKDVLSDVVKLFKKQPSGGSNVVDVWFGSGSVLSEVKSESSLSVDVRGRDFYAVRGLTNLGNTCFFNSVLQNILAMDRFRDDLLKLGDSTGPLTNSLKKVYAEIYAESGVRNVLSPKSLFGSVCSKAPQFRGYQQQDSHELLRYLLDGLATEDLRVKKSTNSCPDHEKSSHVNTSFVDVIFGGQLSSTVCCVECAHSSVVYEPYLDLSLPVPTKKPPPKKAPTVSRNRKTKPPPRKVGKTRPKLGRDGISAPVLIGPKLPSEYTNGLLPTAVTANDEGGSVNGSSSVCPTDHGDMVHSNGSLSQTDGISASAESKGTDFSNAAQQATSVDDSSWMDCTEPMSLADGQYPASISEELPANQVSGRTDATQNNVTHQDESISSDQVLLPQGTDSLNAAPQEIPVDDSAWMDFLEPTSLVEQEDWALQPDEGPANQDSGRTDTSLTVGFHQESDTPRNEAPDVMCDSFINSYEDEVPLQVGDSQVLLLPYNEEPVAVENFIERDIEPSSSAVGDGEDMMGLDGFADMFNEPEVTMGPHPKPSTGSGEDMENGFLAGHSSESNPDEVDDTDSPVSIESCLSHFTKPELLADEHAWHCENCTKVMHEIRKKSRKRKMKPLSATQNGCADNILSVGVGETNQNNGTPDSDRELQEVDTKQIRHVGDQLANGFSGACETSANFPTAEIASVSDNNSSNSSEESAKIAADEAIGKASEVVEDGDSGESDEEEADSKNVKAMRNATKRILISKLPPILTIHLKRFNQDARGRLSKLNGHVVFKEIVDLRPYMDPRCPERQVDCKYRLIGLVEHLGSMRGGHYVAYVRGGDRKKGEEAENRKSVWYYASDAHVRETTLEEVLRCEAYILFYEKI